MPDRPEAPPRSPFAARPAAPAAPLEEDVVVFEDLGYSPDELSPDAVGVVPLLLHWTSEAEKDRTAADLGALDSLGAGGGFSGDLSWAGARREAAWADPFARAAAWELGGGWAALGGLGQAELILDSEEEDWVDEGPDAQADEAATDEAAEAADDAAEAAEAAEATDEAAAAAGEEAQAGPTTEGFGELDLAAEAAALLSELADAIAAELPRPASAATAPKAPSPAAASVSPPAPPEAVPAAAAPAAPPPAAAAPAPASPPPSAAEPPAAPVPEQGGWLRRNVHIGSVLLRGLAKEITRKPTK